jgi:hypothetical protein
MRKRGRPLWSGGQGAGGYGGQEKGQTHRESLIGDRADVARTEAEDFGFCTQRVLVLVQRRNAGAVRGGWEKSVCGQSAAAASKAVTRAASSQSARASPRQPK